MPIRDTQAVRAIMGGWNEQILMELNVHGRAFTANDYLNKFESFSKEDYENCLRYAAGDYRVFNSWFARWYLIGLEKRGVIERVGTRRAITSVHNNLSRNVEWRVLTV